MFNIIQVTFSVHCPVKLGLSLHKLKVKDQLKQVALSIALNIAEGTS
jgi:hypothetical protein